MDIAKRTSTYAKFLTLANAVRQMPTLPVLDAIEERLLSVFLDAWEAGKQVPVTEAARMVDGVPERTAFRRIKSLQDKGLLTFEPSPLDQRVKFIVPTKAAERYFDALGRCIEQARDSLWPTTQTMDSKPK